MCGPFKPERYPASPGYSEPTTSKDAAAAIAGHAADLKPRILELLRTGARLTADEIAARLGANILSVRPRVTELYATAKIERTGIRRPNQSGAWAHVWRIAP